MPIITGDSDGVKLFNNERVNLKNGIQVTRNGHTYKLIEEKTVHSCDGWRAKQGLRAFFLTICSLGFGLLHPSLRNYWSKMWTGIEKKYVVTDITVDSLEEVHNLNKLRDVSSKNLVKKEDLSEPTTQNQPSIPEVKTSNEVLPKVPEPKETEAIKKPLRDNAWRGGYLVSLKNRADYEELKGILLKRGLSVEKNKISFHDQDLYIELGYSEHELRILIDWTYGLKKFFGNGYKTCFDNYLSLAAVKRLDTKISIEESLKELHNDITKNEDLMKLQFSMKNSIKELLSEAENFLATVTPFHLNFSSDSSASEPELIHNLLKDHEGLIIGEGHSSLMSKKFFLENVEKFKQEGVATLFLEHIVYDTMQDELDAYFEQTTDELPSMLNLYLRTLDTKFFIRDENLGYTALVVGAKKAGIRIVAIESEASYRAGSSSRDGVSGSDRHKAMNYQAHKIIKKEKGKGKFVALVGSTHMTRYMKVPGLTEMLRCPHVLVAKSCENEAKGITYNEKNVGRSTDEVGIDLVQVVLRK